MKKNGQYVGVDEKYIPEDEKYVDNDVNKEIKDSVNAGIKSVKDYMLEDENKEKIKRAGKKGLKVAKTVGIGYLVFVAIIFIMVIAIFIFTFINIGKINKRIDDKFNTSNNKTENSASNINNTNDNYSKDYMTEAFNGPYELYSGYKSGFFANYLLDITITNNKTSNHVISVFYDDTTNYTIEQITNIKQKIDNDKNYDISLEYDMDGYVNKIIIK